MSDAANPGVTVSVVVPCKNDARYLSANLESILSQDYPWLECIVVDGGSTDATVDLLKQYGDRIRWVSEPDSGAFDAINRGWKLSKGDILAWLNADDLWLPGAVCTAVRAFRNRPQVDVVYGTAGVIDELGRRHGDLVPRKWDLEYALRYCDHIIFQPASFIRRPVLEKVGWLYPAWCHDHDLWLRIALAGGTFAKVPDRLAMDRLRLDNLGQLARIVVPGKIGLTKRFFTETGLPPDVRRLRRRAMSGAYLRALDYLRRDQLGHWLWAFRLLMQALVTDPLNVRAIGGRVLRPVRLRRFVPRVKPRVVLRATGRALVQVITFPFTLSGRILRKTVERVFARGNRRLGRKVDDVRKQVEELQKRVTHDLDLQAHRHKKKLDAVERAVPKALVPLTEGIDRIAAETAQLAGGIERDRQKSREVVDSLRQQHEARFEAVEQALPRAIEPLTTRIDGLAAALPQLVDIIQRDRRQVVEALDSLRHEHDDVRAQIKTAIELLPRRSGERSEVYSTPPTLRPIPGWHWSWGADTEIDPFTQDRRRLWESLPHPVLMRWFSDLQIMIWPDNESSRVLFLTGTFEPNELTWVSHTLTKGMTMIDLGANMGVYSMLASKLVGESGSVVAVEPSARDFQRLAFHVTLNNLQNVRCLHLAASDDSGQAVLKVASDRSSGHNTFGDFCYPAVERAREEIVQTRPLDALVAEQKLQRVDLLKVDVEGHESKVLMGATETLAHFRPKILIEASEKALRNQGTSVEAVLTFLKRQRYGLHEFSDATGELVPLSRSLGNESENLVALPD